MEEYQDKVPTRERETLDPGAILRGIATLLGLGITIVGLFFAIQVFNEIHDAMKEPEKFQETVKKWAQVLGVPPGDVKAADELVPLAQAMSLVAVYGGYFLMSIVALGLMNAGGRIISWSSGDREAVRKILKEAFGPRVGNR